MTASITEIELIEHLDFDHGIACESTSSPCDNEAEWSVRMSCCGQQYLLCDEHKEYAVMLEDIWVSNHARCVTCGVKVSLPVYTDWQPIKA